MNNSFKISVKNGSNVISFELKNAKTNSVVESANLLSSEIICELQNLNDTNVRLKSIGYKGNFFKFTLGRKCILTIESIIENENTTFIKSLEFSFGKLEKLENPELGLNIILQGAINANRNSLQIC